MSKHKIPEGLRHALSLWHDLFSASPQSPPGQNGHATPQAALRIAEELVNVAHLDTIYADLYLQRARDILRSELSEDEYAGLLRLQTEAANLPNRIRNAISVGAWAEVRTLAARLSTLNQTLSDTQDVRTATQNICEFGLDLVDPFSLGLSELAGALDTELPAMRDRAIALLAWLREANPDWGELYAARRAALAGLNFAAPARGSQEPAAPSEQAEQALASGDLERLESLASRLSSEVGSPSPGTPQSSHATSLPDLTYSFSPETVARAARLGLAPLHVESVRTRVKELYRHAWRPTLPEEEGAAQGAVRVPVRFAPHTPAALRERLELYLDRPFVNSGGARDLPYLAEEDFLVETFDEPTPGSPPAHSALLDALGLSTRYGLSRDRLARALFVRGNEIVRDMGLDPRAFRLVCIPSDLHVRIGHKQGWGTQPFWTHLDGWMVLPRHKFLALAGGDVRFGGIYDLVGVGAHYDSDHIFARLAVVLRRRMAAW